MIDTPQPLYLHERDPGWDRRPVWTGTEILAAIGVRSRNLPGHSGRYPGTRVYRTSDKCYISNKWWREMSWTPGRRSDEFGTDMWVCEYGWLRIVAGGRNHCVVAAMNLRVLHHTRITTNPVWSNPQNNHQNNFTVWNTCGGSRADNDASSDCFVCPRWTKRSYGLLLHCRNDEHYYRM